MMEKNTIHHADWMTNDLPDGSVNLIIADPPYFEVRGDFDFVWDSFDDYLKDVEKWAIECKRLLAENGTLFWYGDAKRIAYAQMIFDKYFNLVNSLIWENTNPHKQQIRFSKGLRSFAPITERILMYSNDQYNLTQCVFNIRDYIREEIQKAKGKISFKEINQALGTATNGGGVASACLSLKKSEPAMMTKEMYQKIQKWWRGRAFQMAVENAFAASKALKRGALGAVPTSNSSCSPCIANKARVLEAPLNMRKIESINQELELMAFRKDWRFIRKIQRAFRMRVLIK